MDSKGGPQSSEKTKEKKKIPSHTKPNNGQNSPTHSAGPSTPSNSNKQEPSQGAGDFMEGKPELISTAVPNEKVSTPVLSEKESASEGLSVRERRETSSVSNQQEDTVSEKLKSTLVSNEKVSTSEPNEKDSASEGLSVRERRETSSVSNQQEDNVSEKLKERPHLIQRPKEPTESDKPDVDAAGIGKKTQDTR